MNSIPTDVILIIEDDNALRESICDFLDDEGFTTISAENGSQGIKLIKEKQPDLILTDLRMPIMNGIEVLHYVEKCSPSTPIIVISGGGDISDVVDALKLGAWDYILKPVSDMSIILHAVHKVLERAQLQKENRNYQENLETMLSERTKELQITKDHQQGIIDGITDLLMVVDLTYVVTMLNSAAKEFFGVESISNNYKCFELFHDDGKPCVSCFIKHVRNNSTPFVNEISLTDKKTGKETPFELVAAPLLNRVGETAEVIFLFRDITKRKELENILHQTEKVEAIGQLAGGVAHDFNNMLSGIIGATELLKDELTYSSHNGAEYLEIIQKSAERAAKLTAKLLAFGRKQPIKFDTIKIHDVIYDTVQLLNNTIDKKIEIHTNLCSEDLFVVGDSSLLQNVFLNLGINSSHAMPRGGSLTYKTQRITLSEETEELELKGLSAGKYAEIDVIDTGSGIPQEALSRVFEPFYTTKEQGKGTGLGLAAAHGTIIQHKGIISVSSLEGQGTSFKILLPLSSEQVEAQRSGEGIISGDGTILLVDDELVIRTVGTEILRNLGYEVLLAENGEEGVEIYKKHVNTIDLVILDMIMPRMNGRECCEQIKAINPEARILFSSGYSDNKDLDGLNKSDFNYLHKPFTIGELSLAVSEVLRTD